MMHTKPSTRQTCNALIIHQASLNYICKQLEYAVHIPPPHPTSRIPSYRQSCGLSSYVPETQNPVLSCLHTKRGHSCDGEGGRAFTLHIPSSERMVVCASCTTANSAFSTPYEAFSRRKGASRSRELETIVESSPDKGRSLCSTELRRCEW